MRCEACGGENIDGARFCAKCGGLLPIEEHAADPLIGQVIGGRYRITGVLGEGGMGVVYEAEQQMGSAVRKVAVKTLHPQLSKDPSVLARFHRECGTVAQLEHPNTIRFYDFGATPDGTLYIAMEFVKGQALSQVIEQGAMPPDRVLHIMKQVSGALDEAHNLGVIHRDLKPENIILTSRAGETDFVKVLDFGIAARTESADAQKEQKLTQQGMVLGTPPYMSPEQFTGKPLDARSDIYSLGVMAYEMLTGRLPFEAETPWQWATQHMMAQPLPFEATPAAAAVPQFMRAAVMRALAKDKEGRQASAKQFYAELSGGGGITIDEPARSSLGGSATAAMPATPQFAGAPANAPAYASMPMASVPSAAAMPSGAMPAVATSLPGAATGYGPAPLPAPHRSGGGKALIIGLVGVGVALLGAIAVVFVRSNKPTTDQPLTNPFTSASASAATTIAPQVDSQSATQATATNTATAKPPATHAVATHTAEPVHTAAVHEPSINAAEACQTCINDARNGNIAGAAANYGRCNDGSSKSRCMIFARARAPAAARSAAMQQHCAQARAIAAAAERMGAGTPRLQNAVNGCR
jgi:eukaryotic-like serine/threonine-protein kinase